MYPFNCQEWLHYNYPMGVHSTLLEISLGITGNNFLSRAYLHMYIHHVYTYMYQCIIMINNLLYGPMSIRYMHENTLQFCMCAGVCSNELSSIYYHLSIATA